MIFLKRVLPGLLVLMLTVIITAVNGARKCYYCKDPMDGVCKELETKDCNEAAATETNLMVMENAYSKGLIILSRDDTNPKPSLQSDEASSPNKEAESPPDIRKKRSWEYHCSTMKGTVATNGEKMLIKGCAKGKADQKCVDAKEGGLNLTESMFCTCNEDLCNGSSLPKFTSIWGLGFVCLLLLVL